MRYISDLHVHPSFKPYNRLGFEKEKKDIWIFIPENRDLINQLPGLIRDVIGPTKKHSQTNVDSLQRGQVRGVFCALHPFERGWLVRKKGFLSGLANLLYKYDKRKDKIAAALAGMHADKVRKILREEVDGGKAVDYYKETFAEYKFLKSFSNPDNTKAPPFVIATNFEEYKHYIYNYPETTVGILTLEGGHAFGKFPKWNTHLTDWFDLSDEEQNYIETAYFKNLDKIKGVNYRKGSDIFEPKHTPFFTTLVHMYNNYLAGHAKSYSGLTNHIFDQRMGMDGDITQLGMRVIKRLLHRDENERRILIDVKHLSLASRQRYYKLLEVINKQEDKPIPILFSHGAVSGCCFCDVEGKDEEKLQKESYLSAMRINLCEEDVVAIINSNGLIGLSPHEGRMPGKKAKKKKKQLVGYSRGRLFEYYRKVREFYIRLFMANVFYIVKVGKDNPEIMHGRDPWDHICIGSDYDGIMDPFDIYRTANDFTVLIGDIQHFLENPEDLDFLPQQITANEIRQRLMLGYTPRELAEKIAYKNTENFLKEYFTEAYLMKKEAVPA